jgi:hypothetical protein
MDTTPDTVIGALRKSTLTIGTASTVVWDTAAD